MQNLNNLIDIYLDLLLNIQDITLRSKFKGFKKEAFKTISEQELNIEKLENENTTYYNHQKFLEKKISHLHTEINQHEKALEKQSIVCNENNITINKLLDEIKYQQQQLTDKNHEIDDIKNILKYADDFMSSKINASSYDEGSLGQSSDSKALKIIRPPSPLPGYFIDREEYKKTLIEYGKTNKFAYENNIIKNQVSQHWANTQYEKKIDKEFTHPLEGIHARITGHQLALLANGRIDEIRATLGNKSDYEISHLCHHKWCVNNNHLVVESKLYNRARNSCKESSSFYFEDGTDHYPCPHGEQLKNHYYCILDTSSTIKKKRIKK
ncbi:unnamed protein product [Cunninghamella blakesleeana]